MLKKLPLQHEDEGVPGCMLREVSLLKELHHPNVVQLKDVFFLPSKTLYLLFEWCDYDLKRYMRSLNYQLTACCIQSFTYQMLNGLAWCHSHRILHRWAQHPLGSCAQPACPSAPTKARCAIPRPPQ